MELPGSVPADLQTQLNMHRSGLSQGHPVWGWGLGYGPTAVSCHCPCHHPLPHPVTLIHGMPLECPPLSPAPTERCQCSTGAWLAQHPSAGASACASSAPNLPVQTSLMACLRQHWIGTRAQRWHNASIGCALNFELCSLEHEHGCLSLKSI